MHLDLATARHNLLRQETGLEVARTSEHSKRTKPWDTFCANTWPLFHRISILSLMVFADGSFANNQEVLCRMFPPHLSSPFTPTYGF